jgi:hypothetical protein
MPTEQRGRRHQESLPAVAREEPAEGSQEGAVGFSVPDAAMELALKGPHLVTQDHKLDVLVSSATPGRGHERQDPAQPEVHKRKGHSP